MYQYKKKTRTSKPTDNFSECLIMEGDEFSEKIYKECVCFSVKIHDSRGSSSNVWWKHVFIFFMVKFHE